MGCIVIVHRPLYEDWSLPKGKLRGEESGLDCAVSEVFEETGLWCVPLLEAGGIPIYRSPWPRESSRVLADGAAGCGVLAANDEVDVVRSLSVTEAVVTVTRQVERALLAVVRPHIEVVGASPEPICLFSAESSANHRRGSRR